MSGWVPFIWVTLWVTRKTKKSPVFWAFLIDAIQNGILDLPMFGFELHAPDIERTIPKGVPQ